VIRELKALVDFGRVERCYVSSRKTDFGKVLVPHPENDDAALLPVYGIARIFFTIQSIPSTSTHTNPGPNSRSLCSWCPELGYDSALRRVPSGKPLWVQRFKVWSCCVSLSVGIFPRTPSESLDGRGVETSSCGKLPLDKPFRQLSSAPNEKSQNLE